MINTWIYRTLSEQQIELQNKLAEELSINPLLAQLLVQRDIVTFDDARGFFRPDLNDLHDPFLMADMHNAVNRLTKAMRNNEKILVYGDYDVDGTTSVALVYKFLKMFYANVDFYIPDRYNEGYGISILGIDFAAANDFKLVIALDCGIKAVEKVRYALSKGVDFIICDHHTPDDVLPPAVAVLDSKRSDCNYPYKHLSGCGVGFKLMQAFAMTNDIDFSRLTPLLDLVALSIASDIVPITGENRILAFFGLKQINSNPSVGLKGILEVCGLADKEITISDIVFKIGPRINASGRMKLASEAVELLVSSDQSFAKEKSDTINEYNNDRKDLDKNITDEAIALITADKRYDSRKSIVVYKPDWHKGVIGIVASRLSEEYYKPSIVLTKSNGLASGSARSVPGFDIYKAIESCRDLLENFGGHMYAAGLSMKEENVTEFTERFEQFVTENILEEQTYPQIEIDAVVEFKDITPKFFRVLKQFGPFGPDNMKPVFVSKKVFDYGTSRLVGKEQEHLKLELVDSSSENVMYGIAFRMHEFNEPLKALNPLDICYTLEENSFNGNTSIQLMIRDIKIDENLYQLKSE
jgi:single-stranded-DNA-specific exonuclease